MKTKSKYLKIVLTVILSVLVSVAAPLSAYAAADSGSGATEEIILKKGKVYDQKGKLYTGQYKKDGYSYYAENGKRIKGWKKLNKKYYYFEPDYRMAINKIVGSVSKGYYYVDKTGVRVTSDEVRMAVRFVTANSSRKSRQREQLRQCFDALRRYPYLNKGDTPPKASQLPSYARFMFTSKCGDCYYYGVTMAYIARVLGYDSRVAAGGVTAWGPTYPLSPHGWCEVRKGTEWKMMDCSMQNGHPDANLFFVTRKQYPYRLRCDKIYALNISDGKVTWR